MQVFLPGCSIVSHTRQGSPFPEKFGDLRPMASHDFFSIEMTTLRKGLQFDSGAISEVFHRFVWYIRIVFGMKHQQLRRGYFLRMMRGVVELASFELRPVAIGEAIGVSEGLADVR